MARLSGDGFHIEHLDGVPVFRLDRLEQVSRLVHAIFTRQGGVSRPPFATLNMGHAVGDAPDAVDTNHQRAYRALQICRSQVVACHLVHGTAVLVATAADSGHWLGAADALITDKPGLYLSMRFADCLPILLNDAPRGVVGLVHAGWRGTVKNVAEATVQAMVDELGCSRHHITAVIGPAIGPCCYQVGDEVIQAVEAAFDRSNQILSERPDQRVCLDLWEANRQQLVDAGVGQVIVMRLCTACHTGLFFSHRAERGRTGRFGVVIGYRDQGG